MYSSFQESTKGITWDYSYFHRVTFHWESYPSDHATMPIKAKKMGLQKVKEGYRHCFILVYSLFLTWLCMKEKHKTKKYGHWLQKHQLNTYCSQKHSTSRGKDYYISHNYLSALFFFFKSAVPFIQHVNLNRQRTEISISLPRVKFMISLNN